MNWKKGAFIDLFHIMFLLEWTWFVTVKEPMQSWLSSRWTKFVPKHHTPQKNGWCSRTPLKFNKKIIRKKQKKTLNFKPPPRGNDGFILLQVTWSPHFVGRYLDNPPLVPSWLVCLVVLWLTNNFYLPLTEHKSFPWIIQVYKVSFKNVRILPTILS